MIRLAACLLVLALAAPVPAQEQPEAIRLTIRPAAAPVPALKCLLLPDLQERTPGNAVMPYMRAVSPEWTNWQHQQQILLALEKARTTPLDQLPRQELGWVLTAKQFVELDLGARRDFCEWEYTPRIRREGFALLLPEVQSFRNFASALAVRTRFHLADREFDKAVYSLQTGFALSRDVANNPSLIQTLVGQAMARILAGQVDEFIQTPGSPNLYWALADLPQPFITLRRALEGERLFLKTEFVVAADLETTHLTPTQERAVLEHLYQVQSMIDTGQPRFKREEIPGQVKQAHTHARRELVARGMRAENLDAMPALQVVLLHSFREHQRYQDEAFKWANFPYWQARPEVEKLDRQLTAARKRGELLMLSNFLPAYLKTWSALVKLDRRLAAQRIVEAIRQYAAGREGKLPSSLADLTASPAPPDPVTGRPFTYKTDGDRATLSAGELTYELTLTR